MTGRAARLLPALSFGLSHVDTLEDLLLKVSDELFVGAAIEVRPRLVVTENLARSACFIFGDVRPVVRRHQFFGGGVVIVIAVPDCASGCVNHIFCIRRGYAIEREFYQFCDRDIEDVLYTEKKKKREWGIKTHPFTEFLAQQRGAAVSQRAC